MSIGAPPRPARKRRFPLVFVIAVVVLAGLDVFGLHALGQGWAIAGVAGGVAALLGAAFAHIWYDAGSSSKMSMYFVPRSIALAVFSAIATGIALLVGAPVVAAFGIGLGIGLCCGIAFMIFMGEL